MKRRITIVCICFVWSLSGLSQDVFCLRARVLYFDKKEPAGGISIKFYDSENDFLTFTYTNDDGSFQKCFSQKHIALKINGMTVKDTVLKLILGKTVEQTIYIQRKVNRLDEIIMESKKAARDTIDYILDTLQFKSDDKLSDILKQLPGFEVRNGNEIYHNGKLVKRVLVDGKDFLTSNQEIALDNFTKQHLESLSVYNDYKDPFRNYLQAERGDLALDLKASKHLRGIPTSKAKLFGGYRDRYATDIDFMYLRKKSFTFLKNALNNTLEKPNFSQEERLGGAFFSNAYGLFNQNLVGSRNFINYSNAYYKYQDDKTFVKLNIYPKYADNSYQSMLQRNSETGSYRMDRNTDKTAFQWYSALDATRKWNTFIGTYSFLYDYVDSSQKDNFRLNHPQPSQAQEASTGSRYTFLERGHTYYHQVLADKAFSGKDILTTQVSYKLRFYEGNSVFSDDYAPRAVADYSRSDLKTSLAYKKQLRSFSLNTFLDYSKKTEQITNTMGSVQNFKLNIDDAEIGETLQFKFWKLKNDFSFRAQYNTPSGGSGNWVYPFSLETTYAISGLTNLAMGANRSYFNNFSEYALYNRRTNIDTYLSGDPMFTRVLSGNQSGFLRFSYLNTFKNRSFHLSGELYERFDTPGYNVGVSGNEFLYRVFFSDQKGVRGSCFYSYQLPVYKRVFLLWNGNLDARTADVFNKTSNRKEYDTASFDVGIRLTVSNRLEGMKNFKLIASINYGDSENSYQGFTFKQQNLTQSIGISYASKRLTSEISYSTTRNYSQSRLLTNFETINLSSKLTLTKRSGLTLSGINLLSLIKESNITSATGVSNAQNIESVPIMSYIGLGYFFKIL